MYTHMKHGMTFYVLSMTSYYALLTHPVPRCQFASQSFFLQTTCIFPPQQQCMMTFFTLFKKLQQIMQNANSLMNYGGLAQNHNFIFNQAFQANFQSFVSSLSVLC